MTPEQQTYVDRVAARVHAVNGSVDVSEAGEHSIRITVEDEDGDVRARIIVSPGGQMMGAWDPDRLTDIIDADTYGSEDAQRRQRRAGGMLR